MKNENVSIRRLMEISEACLYLSLGRNKTMEFCESINAVVRIGRRCLYDKVIIDEYLNGKYESERKLLG
ncbi:MAG: hypothetical protein K0S18_282 [Anaerocolumna sp.]|nr:hypothetical protein [Anaerocolumna sp.]